MKTNILKHFLADNYALYIKTQNYHWNIEGENFKSLHDLFEDHYRDLAESIDVLAELIRGIGDRVPASFEEYLKLTQIKSGNENFTSQGMVNDLLNDHVKLEKLADKARQGSEGDEVIIGFLIERMTFHRKASWMLRSSLKK